jgi:hypothetical protein
LDRKRLRGRQSGNAAKPLHNLDAKWAANDQRAQNWTRNLGLLLKCAGQSNPQPNAAELREFMITISPYGFINAALAANDATFEQRTLNRLGEGVKTNVIGFTAGKYWITGEFN